MQSRSALSVLVIPTALALASCGGDHAPDPIPYADFRAAYVAATCDFARQCPVPGYEGGAYAELAAMQREDCLEAVGGSLPDGLPYDASIASGTITFDEMAAGECIDAMTRGCGGPRLISVFPSCLTMFEGNVAVGGSCTIDADCADGGSCMRTDAATCGGTCAAAPGLGAACSPTEPCSRTLTEDGLPLFCGTTAANPALHCVAARTRFVKKGATCGQIEGAGDEATLAVCPSNTSCHLTSATTGTCEAPLALGASCSTTTDACAVTDACVVAEGAATGTCVNLPTPVSEGGACSVADLKFCNTALDLACEDGFCRKFVRGGLGDACALGTDGCDDGLYCRPGDAQNPTVVCAALLPGGAECDAGGGYGNISCESGFCDATVDPPVCAPVDLICF